MSLTDEERAIVDERKAEITAEETKKHLEELVQIAYDEFAGGELQDLSAEDRIIVDDIKIDIQTAEDARIREEELLAIALQELGE